MGFGRITKKKNNKNAKLNGCSSCASCHVGVSRDTTSCGNISCKQKMIYSQNNIKNLDNVKSTIPIVWTNCVKNLDQLMNSMQKLSKSRCNKRQNRFCERFQRISCHPRLLNQTIIQEFISTDEPKNQILEIGFDKFPTLNVFDDIVQDTIKKWILHIIALSGGTRSSQWSTWF